MKDTIQVPVNLLRSLVEMSDWAGQAGQLGSLRERDLQRAEKLLAEYDVTAKKRAEVAAVRQEAVAIALEDNPAYGTWG